MPDPRFYRRTGPHRLADLAARAGATLAPGVDPGMFVRDIGQVDDAAEGEIIYVAAPQYLDALAGSRCSACVTTPAFAAKVPPGCAVLLASDPRRAFVEIAAVFYPRAQVFRPAGAVPIAPDAQISPDAAIAPGVVIGAGATIGSGTSIGANTVIGPGVVIGAHCTIGATVTLAYCLVGDRVLIHPGVQVGQDGFGFVSTAAGHGKVPQLGRVIIHDDVEIGANCAVDRGAAGDTVIGAGTKIDNLVHIGHNVEIGERCIIIAQVGIAGSCRIGNDVVIGGQVALSDHVHIGDHARIAGQSGIIRDVASHEVVMGYPAKPIRQFWREIATLSRLTKRNKEP